MEIRIKTKIIAAQIPCTERHFTKFIKNKKLEVIREYSSMVRVRDASGEEWNLFNNQINVVTGL